VVFGGVSELWNETVRQVTLEAPVVGRLSRGSHGLGVMKGRQASCGLDVAGPDLRFLD
jgi:hypothetical protein